MKIDLDFAELHTPLFYGKINWGLKLQPRMGTKGSLILAYDREHKELLVRHGNFPPSIIPLSNVVSMTPKVTGEEEATKIPENKHQTQVLNSSKSAQVDTPMSHVQGGVGRGRKRD